MTPLIKIINNQQTLNLFQKSIINAQVIALDTEFTRKKTYYPKLSTIQICTQENMAFIADYLEYPDLTINTLNIIYESSAIKVFHAAQNDLEIFYNLIQQLPSNVFDTQIAFLALSSESPISYAHLIDKLFNIKVNKSCRLSNWEIRPITSEQLKYAALDVILLYKAYFNIIKLLNKQNRMNFISEKIIALTNESFYKFNLQNTIKNFIEKKHVKKNLPLLAALLDCREKAAQSQNIPKQHILTDDYIKLIVNNPSIIKKEVKFNTVFTTKIWKSIQNNLKLYYKYSKITKKNYIKQPYNVHNKSWKLLQSTSNEENINHELICTKKELKDFVNFVINTSYYFKILKNKELTKFFVDWRYNIFTKKLLKNIIKI